MNMGAAAKIIWELGRCWGLGERGRPLQVFWGQGIGIAKAVLSLTMFHEARILIADKFKNRNKSLGLIPEKPAKQK